MSAQAIPRDQWLDKPAATLMRRMFEHHWSQPAGAPLDPTFSWLPPRLATVARRIARTGNVLSRRRRWPGWRQWDGKPVTDQAHWTGAPGRSGAVRTGHALTIEVREVSHPEPGAHAAALVASFDAYLEAVVESWFRVHTEEV